MAVVIASPMQTSTTSRVVVKGDEEWRESLCGCCNDIGICCVGCWCPCILFGQNQEQLDGHSCCGTGCVYCVLLCLPCISVVVPPLCCLISAPRRRILRQRYGLREDCNDWCATCCCYHCALCQEAREMKVRGPPAVHIMSMATTSPYQQANIVAASPVAYVSQTAVGYPVGHAAPQQQSPLQYAQQQPYAAVPQQPHYYEQQAAPYNDAPPAYAQYDEGQQHHQPPRR